MEWKGERFSEGEKRRTSRSFWHSCAGQIRDEDTLVGPYIIKILIIKTKNADMSEEVRGRRMKKGRRRTVLLEIRYRGQELAARPIETVSIMKY